MSDQQLARPGIPAIAPYPMPTAADLPAAAVDWTPDPARAVLLLHDMQEFFLRPFPPGQAPVTDLVRNATALRERCGALGVPVAFTAQPGGMTTEQRGLLRDFWGDGMSLDPASRRIVDPLAPRPGDWLLTKWRYSAFQRSDLRDRLRDAGRDQLLICGVYAHVGVLMTAVDAFSQDVQPFLAADAVADFTAGDHAMALSYAARRCAAVATTGQLLAALDTPVGAGNPAGATA